MNNSKRSYQSTADLNNNKILPSTSSNLNKKKKSLITTENESSYTIGQIKEIRTLNFMCHKNFAIEFHPTPMQIITGANGSGKSAIANAICLCLGSQARATGRTTNVQSFIRKGETVAELSLTLANEGLEAYKPELYGKEIQIVRRIGAKSSTYKVLNQQRKVVSTHKDTIAEIIQSLSISPDNPLCILHQETAKTFLLNNDARKKYLFYMKVSQLDHIKQAYEDAVCTAETIGRRINGMTQRYMDMVRATEPFEREIKRIEDRRDKEVRQRELELELNSAQIIESQQELANVQIELDQTQKTRDSIELQLNEVETKIRNYDRKIEDLNGDKIDAEKDLSSQNSPRHLEPRFTREKKELNLTIQRLSNECQSLHKKLEDLRAEEVQLNKQINEYQTFTQQSSQETLEHEKFEKELQLYRQQQIDCDKQLAAYQDEFNLTNENLKKKQSTLVCIQNELKQKQQDIDDLKKRERGQTNVYGAWMHDCLQAIEKERRFHRKPLGPIGRYIRCNRPEWSYAIEKHLAACMETFICSDRDDERILLEIFSRCCPNARPQINVRNYSAHRPDISGTLNHVRNANLLPIYDVLTIDNPIVETYLIDNRQIEATILLKDLGEAKRIRKSGLLRWESVYQKVKQVVEAWAADGSNIKFGRAFRIYTNERQAVKYFTSNNTQALSINELERDLKQINDQIHQTNLSMNELRKNRQGIIDNLERGKKIKADLQKKIQDLTQKIDRYNSRMPETCAYLFDELKEKLDQCTLDIATTTVKFNEAKEEKENKHKLLSHAIKQLEGIEKKVTEKTRELDGINEKLSELNSERQELQQHIPRLMKKFDQLNEDIQRCQQRYGELTKTQPKKSKVLKTTNRSVREIQHELTTLTNYLKSHEDTREQRQKIIEEYRTKRQNAQAARKLRDKCQKQHQRLETFVNKRKERFGQIADQHRYLLRHKFRDLMSKHNFDDCDIEIDHKKEELNIIIKKNQRSVASLSGGERSISTFCFLLALWGSIYQPFRLLDEIDIYMDHEKRNSSLELLHQNTQYYSSSQHVIFTPQAIDPQFWKDRNVPVFVMPTPKRSIQ